MMRVIRRLATKSQAFTACTGNFPLQPFHQNKCQNRGVFFCLKLVTIKPPYSPRKPPQIHHDLPANLTPKSQKPSVKHHFSPSEINSAKSHQKPPHLAPPEPPSAEPPHPPTW
jgi:hypothetical protein